MTHAHGAPGGSGHGGGRGGDRRPLRRAGAVAAVAASVLLAGCSGGDGASGHGGAGAGHRSAPAPSAASSSASSSTASASPSPGGRSGTPQEAAHSLAETVEHPCRALDADDAAALHVGIEGSEDPAGGSCSWGALGGLVSYTPSTSSDQTTDERFAGLTRKRIAGHRAVLGSYERDGATVVLVSVGAHRSFRLIVVPFDQGAPGPDTATLGTRFARAILAHVG